MDYEKMSPEDKKAYLDGKARFEKGIEEETRRRWLYDMNLTDYQLLIEFTKSAMVSIQRPAIYYGEGETNKSLKSWAALCVKHAKYIVDELKKHRP